MLLPVGTKLGALLGNSVVWLTGGAKVLVFGTVGIELPEGSVLGDEEGICVLLGGTLPEIVGETLLDGVTVGGCDGIELPVGRVLGASDGSALVLGRSEGRVDG